jgi:hypothetical protein
MAIGSLAGSGPRWWGSFSRLFGTPVNVNVSSGVIATIFMAANFMIAGGSLKSFFGIVLGIVISTTTFSYVLVFPAIIALRMKYGTAGRGYRIPGGMPVVVVLAVLAEFFVVAATAFSLWPNLFSSNVTAPVSVGGGTVARAPYELTVLITMGIILGVGVLFWAFGRSRQTSAEYELVTAEGESILEPTTA